MQVIWGPKMKMKAFLIILFTSLFTFSSKEDAVLIVSVTIVALVGYSSVMQSFSPKRVDYFMLSDYLYLITLVSVITTLLLGIYLNEERPGIREKKAAIIFIYALFISGCVLFGLII